MTKFARYFSFALLFGVLLSSPWHAAEQQYQIVFQNRDGEYVDHYSKKKNELSDKAVYDMFYHGANHAISSNKKSPTSTQYIKYINKESQNKLNNNYPDITSDDLTGTTIYQIDTHGNIISLAKESSDVNNKKIVFPNNSTKLLLFTAIPATLPRIFVNGKPCKQTDFPNQSGISIQKVTVQNFLDYLKITDKNTVVKGNMKILTKPQFNNDNTRVEGSTIINNQKNLQGTALLHLYSSIHITDGTAPDKSKTIFEKFRGLSGIKQFFVVVIVVAVVGVVVVGAAKLIHIWSQKKKLSSLTNEDDTEEGEKEENEEN